MFDFIIHFVVCNFVVQNVDIMHGDVEYKQRFFVFPFSSCCSVIGTGCKDRD